MIIPKNLEESLWNSMGKLSPKAGRQADNWIFSVIELSLVLCFIMDFDIFW